MNEDVFFLTKNVDFCIAMICFLLTQVPKSQELNSPVSADISRDREPPWVHKRSVDEVQQGANGVFF